jgi:hypothetical protein
VASVITVADYGDPGGAIARAIDVGLPATTRKLNRGTPPMDDLGLHPCGG